MAEYRPLWDIPAAHDGYGTRLDYVDCFLYIRDNCQYAYGYRDRL